MLEPVGSQRKLLLFNRCLDFSDLEWGKEEIVERILKYGFAGEAYRG